MTRLNADRSIYADLTPCTHIHACIQCASYKKISSFYLETRLYIESCVTFISDRVLLGHIVQCVCAPSQYLMHVSLCFFLVLKLFYIQAEVETFESFAATEFLSDSSSTDLRTSDRESYHDEEEQEKESAHKADSASKSSNKCLFLNADSE